MQVAQYQTAKDNRSVNGFSEKNDQDKLLIASSSNLDNWHHGKGRGDRGRGDNDRGRGRGKSFGRGRGKSNDHGNQDKSKFRCYECGLFGHFAKECTKWKDKEKGKDQEAHLVWEDDEPTLL
ncbi:hypothetical protein SSX86_029986 [Deinandra increscens subsp. villosa]|uniref:CCHC-type domain-containing protein n=1 Tax=Deinandra increscens subsp. villosa TaxID=3103831 RepID=A0AAP0GKL1_9ASTR